MRKPAVKKFWNMDLYISPVDEVGGSPGESFVFTKGQTQTVAGFDLTFLGFQMGGHADGNVGQVGCAFQLTGDMLIDTITPTVESTPEGMSDRPAVSRDGRFTLAVGRIEANSGSVELQVTDRDNPQAAKSVFWIEISEKPMINLFWAGTTLMVFGGLLALRKRAGQVHDGPSERHHPAEAEVETSGKRDDNRPVKVETV
jgi:hypothetical protein